MIECLPVLLFAFIRTTGKSVAKTMQAQVMAQTAEQVEEQMDAVSDLYRLIQTSCIAKCDDKRREPASNLTIREGVCLDRVGTRNLHQGLSS